MQIFAAAVGISALSGCTPLPSYRYEITVEVDTPSGLRTGSSVVEISARREPKLLPEMSGVRVSYQGEATAVDLPNGRTIFALLEGVTSYGYPQWIASSLLTPEEQAAISPSEAGRVLSAARRAVELPRRAYPLLVTFRDSANPATIEGVDPDALTQFGSGVRLRRITISSTEKPVTEAIQKKLPWLSAETRLFATAPDGVRHGLGLSQFKN
jgi:hypothetical protein